ncbi:MAG: hypothetical protein IPJ73_11120 [Zoogloea sp.]|nr:hypothetical protein [Zoogloea sp.]
MVSNTPSFVQLGTGAITNSGITGAHFIYNLSTNTFTSVGNPVTGGSFSGSASSLNLLLGNMFGPLGAAIGSGSVSVSHAFGGTAGNGTWTIDISETDVGGTGFSGLFAALDSIPAGNPFGLPPSLTDGQFDGRFSVIGGVVRATARRPPHGPAWPGSGWSGRCAAARPPDCFGNKTTATSVAVFCLLCLYGPVRQEVCDSAAMSAIEKANRGLQIEIRHL